jgi:hypothetical protein
MSFIEFSTQKDADTVCVCLNVQLWTVEQSMAGHRQPSAAALADTMTCRSQGTVLSSMVTVLRK